MEKQLTLFILFDYSCSSSIQFIFNSIQDLWKFDTPTFGEQPTKCPAAKKSSYNRQQTTIKMWTLTQPGWALPVHRTSLALELPAALPPRSLLSMSSRWRRCTDNSNEMNWFLSSFSYSSSSRRANSSTNSSDNSLTRLSISSYNSHNAALDMFSMPATLHTVQTGWHINHCIHSCVCLQHHRKLHNWSSQHTKKTLVCQQFLLHDRLILWKYTKYSLDYRFI